MVFVSVTDTQTAGKQPVAFPVAVMTKRLPADPTKPWLNERWRVTGVVVNSQLSGPAGQCIRTAADGDDYLWSGLTLQLYKDEAESYYHNLLSARPCLYVISAADEQGVPRPQQVSASFDEANAYMEAEQEADAVPMPPEIYRWIEGFVLAHYVPEPRRKRSRQDWTEANDES